LKRLFVRFDRNYALDGTLVVIGALLLLSGCFATKAQVVENDSPPPLPVPIAAPLALEKLTLRSGTTNFSVDVVQQAGSGRFIIAGNPPPTVKLAAAVETVLTGWAVDTPAHRGAEAVYVSLDRSVVMPCRLGIERPDVATFLHDAAFAPSGFTCTIPARRIVSGRHTLALIIVAQGGRSYYAAALPTTLDVR
jgi:hypothetical protein